MTGKVAEAAATAAGAVGEVAQSVASTDADTAGRRGRPHGRVGHRGRCRPGRGHRGRGGAGEEGPVQAADRAPPARRTSRARTGPAASRPRPVQAEPEPIDLLEVAGGAAFTQFAKPAAIGVGVLVLVALVVRRIRR